jgi:hypothetical protein
MIDDLLYRRLVLLLREGSVLMGGVKVNFIEFVLVKSHELLGSMIGSVAHLSSCVDLVNR